MISILGTKWPRDTKIVIFRILLNLFPKHWEIDLMFEIRKLCN